MPERIFAWELDHNIPPPNGFYSVQEVDDATEYTRADLTRAQIEAAVKRAIEAAAEAAKSRILTTSEGLAMLTANEARNAIRALADDPEALRKIVEGGE
jgi:hypothetical protein